MSHNSPPKANSELKINISIFSPKKLELIIQIQEDCLICVQSGLISTV